MLLPLKFVSLFFFVTTYSRWHSAMEHHRYHDLEGPEIHLRLVVLYHKRSCSTVVADNASNTTVFENPSKSYISNTSFLNYSFRVCVTTLWKGTFEFFPTKLQLMKPKFVTPLQSFFLAFFLHSCNWMKPKFVTPLKRSFSLTNLCALTIVH